MRIRQYRYFAPEATQNSDLDNLLIDDGSLVIEKDTSHSITQISIQSIPGTKIYFNGETSLPIIIGATGLFEINASSNFIITKIVVPADSLNLIANNPAAGLIIDTIEQGD